MELSLHEDKSFDIFGGPGFPHIYHLPQNASMSPSTGHWGFGYGSCGSQWPLARGVAHLSIFLDCFLHLNHEKSWQLHLILFMKLLSHVFLLKVFMSRIHGVLCSLQKQTLEELENNLLRCR